MSAVIKAEDAVYGGYVLSRENGIVFIRGAIPGELVEVSVSEKKRDYSVASVTGVLEPSEFRVEPPCPIFGVCGGCQLQFASYDRQITMKNEILLDCLKRIGGIEVSLLPPLTGRQFGYRRRGQFKVSKQGAIGFYKENTRDVVPLTNCPLMIDEINNILPALNPDGLTGVRELHITSGDSLVALMKGSAVDAGLAERLLDAGFSGITFEGSSRIFGHNEYAVFDLDGLKYAVSPASFFQSNWDLNIELVRIIKSELGDVGGASVLDLYAGAGNFSLPLAEAGANVTAVEGNPSAVKDGRMNFELNGMTKFKYIESSAEKAGLSKRYDILILDPPRPGLTKAVMQKVLAMDAGRVVYVSCNPSTLARDIKALSGSYDIQSVRMADMFPNTYHVEAVVFLKHKPASEGQGEASAT